MIKQCFHKIVRIEKAVGNGPIKNNDLNDQVRVDNGKTHDIPSGFIQIEFITIHPVPRFGGRQETNPSSASPELRDAV